MSHLVLNHEQAQVVVGALKPVQVRDSSGNLIGTFSPIWTEADIVKAKKILESDGPWKTTAEVLATLRAQEQK